MVSVSGRVLGIEKYHNIVAVKSELLGGGHELVVWWEGDEKIKSAKVLLSARPLTPLAFYLDGEYLHVFWGVRGV